jgi:hypothetical protein
MESALRPPLPTATRTLAEIQIQARLTNPAKRNIIPSIRESRRRVADIKSESPPASNRNRWPASYWNAWPASSETARKLLKKYAFAPQRLVTDDLPPYNAAARDLGIQRRHERGRWSRVDDWRSGCRCASGRCLPSAFVCTSGATVAVDRLPGGPVHADPRSWARGPPRSHATLCHPRRGRLCA